MEMKQYQAYFNQARPHQGIEQRIPRSPKQAQEQQNRGKSIAQPVLGSLHHDYRRRTAGRSSEGSSKVSFPPQPVAPKCLAQQNPVLRQLSTDEMRTRYLM